MNIIIDTHIFLWLIYEPQKVNKKHFSYLEDSSNNLYLSSISVAEMMIKKSLGNLDIDFDLFEIILDMDIEILDFNAKSALLLATLPFHHKDPFDRMIISQSMSNGFKIISEDKKFKMYSCELI
jgi:PIN domain nuclease of toxin-antitoxin system